MAKQNMQKIETHTRGGIPMFRKFGGERYFLLAPRFRSKENAMKLANEIRVPYPRGIGEKAQVIKSSSGKTWLVYRTGKPAEWKGINF